MGFLFSDGQKEDHPIGNELNDSSIIVAHQTLEDTNILSTKAEFGDSSCYETSMDASNPFSSEVLHRDDQKASNLNPFSDPVDSSSFDVESLISSTTNELKDTFDAACNLEPIRSIKEFKTFAECLAEPKLSVTTPELDDNIIPGTPKSTVVEAPISPNSDVSPLPHQEDVESPYEYLSNVPKTPELISPSEEAPDIFTGPTSSSGFESESGADETESNVLLERNLIENDGFIVETKRLSPPIQTLTFKPIEAFGDKNPFGLLENPSPIYKPQVSDEIENIQNLDTGNEIFSNNLSSHLESQDLLMPSFLHPVPSVSEHKDEIVTENKGTEIEITLDNAINIHSESVPIATEESVGQVNEDLGLKQDEFAFGGLESEIKPNEFIFGAGSSELETQQNVSVFESKLHEAPILNENEESKIRLDEQESEQEIETKDAAFGVDSKQEAIDAITSILDKNLVDESIASEQDFSDEPPLFNPFKEENKSVEYEAKESDFQFDPTDIKSDFVLDSFNSGSNDIVFGVGGKKLELDVSKEQSFDTSKEVSNLHENEKESDTAIENVASEEIVSPVTSSLLESTVTKEDLSTTKSPKEELKLELSDHAEGHSSKPPSPKKDLSPLSPTAQPFVPHVPVVEPVCKKVIVEKKFTEPESDETKEETIFNDFENPLLVETNVSPSEHLSSQIPQLDLDTQICLSEPEIHDVREGINEIIKEAELISNLSTVPDHIIDEAVLVPSVLSTDVERVAEMVPQPVSEVLENELIVQSTEPISDSLFSTVTEKEPLSPDHLKIVQESEASIEQEQRSVNQHIYALDVKTLEDINEGSSITGTPPPTPAPGHVEDHGEIKEGLLATAAAVAAAG